MMVCGCRCQRDNQRQRSLMNELCGTLDVRQKCINAHDAAVMDCALVQFITSLQTRCICWRTGSQDVLVLRGAARCCTVLHGAARCCRVLQGAARCCTVLQGAARGCTVLHGAARGCTGLHGAARGRTVLHGAARGCTVPHGAARGRTVPHGAARGCTVLHGAAPCSTVLPGRCCGVTGELQPHWTKTGNRCKVSECVLSWGGLTGSTDNQLC